MEDRFKNWAKPEIEDGKPTKYNWIVKGKSNFKLGKYTDIGAFSYINASAGVEIEDNVQIGSGVKIYSINTIDETSGKIILRKSSKIGTNSVILPNVEIGENSIVGALSLIKSGTKISANEIWVGQPAKKIGEIKDGKRVYIKT